MFNFDPKGPPPDLDRVNHIQLVCLPPQIFEFLLVVLINRRIFTFPVKYCNLQSNSIITLNMFLLMSLFIHRFCIALYIFRKSSCSRKLYTLDQCWTYKFNSTGKGSITTVHRGGRKGPAYLYKLSITFQKVQMP